MQTVSIAMIQTLVEYGRWEDNFSRAKTLLGEAAAAGAQIAVLPECFDLGWAYPAAGQDALPIPGPRSDILSRWAREYGLYLAAGLTERDGDRIYNAAVLLDPHGEILLKHRKINILTDVEGMYSVGDRLGVVDTPLGRVGLAICADNLEDSLALGHSLCRMGAQLILSPSAWAVPPNNSRLTYGEEWFVPYGQLCRLYDVSVVGVSNVGAVTQGAWQGWSCIGNSIAMGPGAQNLAVLPFGEDAACWRMAQVPVAPPIARGTAFGPALRKRGFPG
ncbi:MAG: carbon-nitrogen hydrolase family protein [Eubacteriales bacterium]|nr:carbon-nitrogen hydrolase family protein [Eubacteriales bacterium]